MKDVFEMSLNRDYTVCLANDFVKGRLCLPLIEQKLFFTAVSQVVKADKDFKTFSCTVPELAEFLQVDSSYLYHNLKSICISLRGRVNVIQVKNDNNKDAWKVFGLIDRAEYSDGIFTICLSDDIKPFLIDLDRYYTQCLLGTILSFSSKYTNQLYLRLKCESGYSRKYVFRFTVAELRELFQIPDKKYQRDYNLLQKTIKPALEELSNSDYGFVWDYEEVRSKKRGKPLEYITFKAVLFNSKAIKDEFIDDFPGWREVYDGTTDNPYNAIDHYEIYLK